MSLPRNQQGPYAWNNTSLAQDDNDAEFCMSESRLGDFSDYSLDRYSQNSPLQQPPYQLTANPLTDWALQQQQQQQQLAAPDRTQFLQDAALMNFNPFPTNFQSANALDYLPPTTPLQANLLESTFNAVPTMDDPMQAAQWDNVAMENWQGCFDPFDYQRPTTQAALQGNLVESTVHAAPIRWGNFGTRNELPPANLINLPDYSFGRPSSRASSYGSCDSGASYPPSKERLEGKKKVVQMHYSEFAHSDSSSRKSPVAKATKREKKIRRRKGHLTSEQRKQASEIRKLRACLRCKFFKKTCDKGEPCAGCQPSHARLWQVPCTRIDIKDIGYFMEDWKADYERYIDHGVSVYNVKGFAQKESLMWITHGYGFALLVMVREVSVVDDSCFSVDWVDSISTGQEPIKFEIRTEKLDVGAKGICPDALSEYLDKHIDGPFEDFIDDYFGGTPFITEILKTAHRFYIKEEIPIIRKSLKLVLAYNLTMHITMVEDPGPKVTMDGQIDDENSKYCGRTVAPAMINFQIKRALADMWRKLHKDILEELSALYSGVYCGEKMKNWPTIFIITSVLLTVWEEMQFDCHYRVPDPVAVNKFCTDMETIPVSVIIGLFHAISQKLPAFTDWDTRKHGDLLYNNTSVCEAMTEVRQHLMKHEAYLRTRKVAEFDRNDFDSLSNKLLSKIVVRAN